MRHLFLLLFLTLLSCQKNEPSFYEAEDEIPSEEIIDPYSLRIPPHFPELQYDTASNPITEEGFLLGKKLFMDGRLSRDSSVSCASCHISTSGFTQHGHRLSHGINNRLTKRNAQPIQNLAWEKTFLWDGGVFHLDLFPPLPIENPVEMDISFNEVINRVRKDSVYRTMFKAAFGDDSIKTHHFLQALSQFQLLCISDQSPYDDYMRKEGTLSSEAMQGMQIFEQKCASCHSGALQTDMDFRNNGLPVGNPRDTGRAGITSNPEDRYKFRVPSLRNTKYTFPFMHDGRFMTLDEVLDHYSDGVVNSPTLDPLLKQDGKLGISLTNEEKEKIKAFLETLNDEEFVSNERIMVF